MNRHHSNRANLSVGQSKEPGAKPRPEIVWKEYTGRDDQTVRSNGRRLAAIDLLTNRDLLVAAAKDGYRAGNKLTETVESWRLKRAKSKNPIDPDLVTSINQTVGHNMLFRTSVDEEYPSASTVVKALKQLRDDHRGKKVELASFHSQAIQENVSIRTPQIELSRNGKNDWSNLSTSVDTYLHQRSQTVEKYMKGWVSSRNRPELAFNLSSISKPATNRNDYPKSLDSLDGNFAEELGVQKHGAANLSTLPPVKKRLVLYSKKKPTKRANPQEKPASPVERDVPVKFEMQSLNPEIDNDEQYLREAMEGRIPEHGNFADLMAETEGKLVMEEYNRYQPNAVQTWVPSAANLAFLEKWLVKDRHEHGDHKEASKTSKREDEMESMLGESEAEKVKLFLILCRHPFFKCFALEEALHVFKSCRVVNYKAGYSDWLEHNNKVLVVLKGQVEARRLEAEQTIEQELVWLGKLGSCR